MLPRCRLLIKPTMITLNHQCASHYCIFSIMDRLIDQQTTVFLLTGWYRNSLHPRLSLSLDLPHWSPRPCNLFLSPRSPREINVQETDGGIGGDSRRFPHLNSKLHLEFLTHIACVVLQHGLAPSVFSSPSLNYTIFEALTFWSCVGVYIIWDHLFFHHLIMFFLGQQSADVQDRYCHPLSPNSCMPVEAALLHLQKPHCTTPVFMSS